LIVVDASVLVKALLHDGRARPRLGSEELHAPDLLDLEVVSTLRGLVLGREILEPGARRTLSELGALVLTRHSASPLVPRIWELRSNLTAYDACYVALAERLGCDLVTADARIARAPGLRCTVDVVS